VEVVVSQIIVGRLDLDAQFDIGPTSGGHAAACMFSTDARTRPM
jgi:hypothetical protein